MKKLSLNREQREILCVCIFCQKPLDPDRAGDALEEGSARPAVLVCGKCKDPENAAAAILALGSERAAELSAERTQRAGVFEHFEAAARDAVMRQTNQQN